MKNRIKAIQDDMFKALEAVGKKHGVTFTKQGATTWDADMFYFKTVVTANKEDGTVQTSAEVYWNNMAHLFDLPADALGKEINVDGQRFKIAGLNPRKEKCVSIQGLTGKYAGKSYSAGPDVVKRGLQRASLEASLTSKGA